MNIHGERDSLPIAEQVNAELNQETKPGFGFLTPTNIGRRPSDIHRSKPEDKPVDLTAPDPRIQRMQARKV